MKLQRIQENGAAVVERKVKEATQFLKKSNKREQRYFESITHEKTMLSLSTSIHQLPTFDFKPKVRYTPY